MRASKRAARLVGIAGFAKGEYLLTKRKVALGSASENDCVIPDASISRRHALIRRRFGRHWITDLGSTNGTFVNGRRIAASTRIEKGDEVRLGTARFVFLSASAESLDREARRTSLKAALVVLLLLFAAGFSIGEFFIHHGALQRLASVPHGYRQPVPAATNPKRSMPRARIAASAASVTPEVTSTSPDGVMPEWLMRATVWGKPEFPLDGSTIRWNQGSFSPGWPSPLSSCKGYLAPTGVPIVLAFGKGFAPKLLAFSVAQEDGPPIEICGFDATSYLSRNDHEQRRARADLNEAGAVVLLPRLPLKPGVTYRVSVAIRMARVPFEFVALGRHLCMWQPLPGFFNGHCTWSFSVGR